MAKSNINLDPKQYQEIINQLMTSEAGYAQQLMMAMGMTGAAGASLTAATAAVTAAAATASDSRSGASSRQSSPSPRLSQTPPPSQQVLSHIDQVFCFNITWAEERGDRESRQTLSFFP